MFYNEPHSSTIVKALLQPTRGPPRRPQDSTTPYTREGADPLPLPLAAGCRRCEAPDPSTAEGAAERRASHGRRRRATCAEHGGLLVAASTRWSTAPATGGSIERRQIHCISLSSTPGGRLLPVRNAGRGGTSSGRCSQTYGTK